MRSDLNLKTIETVNNGNKFRGVCHGQADPGLILERAPVPVAHFSPWGHAEKFHTVPTWHTKDSAYFCHSKFYSFEKICFAHLLTIEDLQKICACLRGVGLLHM
jgi:hypothetical protein